MNEWAVPACHVFNSEDIPVPDSTGGEGTLLTFDSERYDLGDFHDAAQPSRLTFQTAGKYHVGGLLEFSDTGQAPVGSRWAVVRLNGSTTIYEVSGTGSADGAGVPVSFDYEFEAGDYVEFFAWQDSGTTMAVIAYAASPGAWAHRFGR